jgi:hypothetical protein
LKRGETPASALTVVRSRVLDLKVQRSQIEAAPLPLDDIKHQVRQRVAEMGTRGDPYVDVSGGTLIVDFQRLTADGRRSIGDVCAWLFPSQMAKSIEAKIEARLAGGSGAMSIEQRRERLGAIKKQLDQAERAEESLVMMCVAAGIAVDRRIDASPAAVLGVKVSKPKAVATAA